MLKSKTKSMNSYLEENYKLITPLNLLQVLTEYILVSVTSAVTVTIAGIVKEAVTILVNKVKILFLTVMKLAYAFS